MKTLLISVMIFLVSISFAFALPGEGRQTVIYNYIPGLTRATADSLYCQQGGNCSFNNLTYNNITYVNYTVTGNLNVSGQICLGGLCYSSWIDLFNASNYYTKAQSDARYLQSESDPIWLADKSDYYTKAEADARFCTNCTGSSTGGNKTLVYANECGDAVCGTFIQVMHNEG